MPDILLLSEDNLLAEDLAEQIELNAPGFKVFRENDGTGHFDIIIVDEDEKKLKPLQTLKIPCL